MPISPEVFARYAEMHVPRYTSYPTAPHFSTAVGEGEYRDWLRQLAPSEIVSIYVHVPFCREMCWYCGCHTTVTARQAPISRYVSALLHEITRVASELHSGLRAGHLHWGGGSPTLLTADQLKLIHGALTKNFEFDSQSENAVEIDPRTMTVELADALARVGVNRASLGVQSFDPKVQVAINRVQTFEVTAAAVRLLRERGIPAINLDLIYGLPFQTVDSCLETVEQALRLQPDRLAVFGYAHVPEFKLHQRRIDRATLPGPAERYAQAEAISRALTLRGYRQIGLDHFALPGDSLAIATEKGKLHRNFQGYTADPCRTLIGFGASAIGRLPGGFVQNSPRLPDYERYIAAGRLATVRGHKLSADDRRRSAIIEQLMCDYRADVSEFGTDSLKLLERDGLIRRSGNIVEVVEDARPLIRAIAAVFDAKLAGSASRHVTAV